MGFPKGSGTAGRGVNPFHFAGRLLVFAGLVVLTWQVTGIRLYEDVPTHPVTSWFHRPNLAFHEAGHFIFMPFGRFITFLGGSLMQCLVPLVLMFAFWFHQRDTFGAAVMAWWLGENLVDLAPYIGDARRLELILLGGRTGAEVDGHDWEYILEHLDLLHLDEVIAQWTFLAGKGLLLAACTWAFFSLLLQSRRLDWK